MARQRVQGSVRVRTVGERSKDAPTVVSRSTKRKPANGPGGMLTISAETVKLERRSRAEARAAMVFFYSHNSGGILRVGSGRVSTSL